VIPLIDLPPRIATVVLMGLLGLPAGGPPPSAATDPTPTQTSTQDTNLLTGDTATLRSSTGTWTASRAAVQLAASSVLGLTSSVDGWVLLQSAAPSVATPATPGTTYRGNLDVRATTVSRVVAPFLMFWDSKGNLLSKVPGSSLTTSTTSWTTTRQVVALAPAGASRVALGLFVTNSSPGERQDISNPQLSASVAPRRAVTGPLHTEGRVLYDATGPITLRGIHHVGFEQNGGWSVVTGKELWEAKRWGANAVRLSLAGPYWQTDTCQAKEGMVGALDTAVSNITGAGMVAILDLHLTATRRCGPLSLQKMPDNSMITFWRDVASRYKSNPLVVFDLFNEPHDVSDYVWLHGGTVKSGLDIYEAPGMQDLYDTVRSAGAQNVVIVSGNNWASTLPSTLVNGYNIVYGAHAYTCPISTKAYQCRPNPLDPSQLLDSWALRTQDVPVMVSEWGWPDAQDGRYAQNVIAYAQSKGWGWIAFAWDGWTNGTFSLVGVSDALGNQPSPAGMPVLDALSRS